MGSVEPIESMFQFTLISLHTDFEFPANQCEAGTPYTAIIIEVRVTSGSRHGHVRVTLGSH